MRARAQAYLCATGGSGVGAYTASSVIALVKLQVVDFIRRRDGYPANLENIALTTGASEGVKRCLAAIISNSNDGVMIPCPQYPLPARRTCTAASAYTTTWPLVILADEVYQEKGRREVVPLLHEGAEADAGEGCQVQPVSAHLLPLHLQRPHR